MFCDHFLFLTSLSFGNATATKNITWAMPKLLFPRLSAKSYYNTEVYWKPCQTSKMERSEYPSVTAGFWWPFKGNDIELCNKQWLVSVINYIL